MTPNLCVDNTPIAGDMVITPDYDIGLLMEVENTGGWVMFVNNGPWTKFKLYQLRRATLKEIKESHLSGVGCNQGQG